MNEVTNIEQGNTESHEAEMTEQSVEQPTNPSIPVTEDLMARVKEAVDFSVTVKPVSFFFKSTKDPETKVSTKRDTLELAIPYPSLEGIVHILENGGTEEGKKSLELLQDAVEGVVTSHVRAMINDDVNINAETLPLDKVSWQYIANMPKAQRNGGGIPKEVWDDFAVDYIAVMPEAMGKTIEACTKAANLLKGKFAAVKGQKPIIEALTGFLAVYADSSENAEEYSACIEFLLNKSEQMMGLSDEDMLANL